MKNTDWGVKPTEQQSGYKTVRTRSGVRMVQHGVVLSEVRSTPGPTHSVADAIAAAVCAVGVGDRVALLGFAGGGLIAPLRAMEGSHRVEAVDLDDSGYRLFRRLCQSWAGAVWFERADACDWLRLCKGRFDTIIDDLSIAKNAEVLKPPVSWSELPSLIYPRLNPEGVALYNLLHPGHGSWATGCARLLRQGFVARVISFRDYENRLLIAARRLPTARQLSHALHARLGAIGSRLASRVFVRNFPLPSVQAQPAMREATKWPPRGASAIRSQGR